MKTAFLGLSSIIEAINVRCFAKEKKHQYTFFAIFPAEAATELNTCTFVHNVHVVLDILYRHKIEALYQEIDK